MNILLIVLIVYIILLNIITSYRLFRDDYYTILQKSIQYVLIWLLPFLGSFTVAFFLSQEINTDKKYPWIAKVIAGFFMVKLTKNAHGFGYPSSMNDNGGYDDGVGYHRCDGFGDGGGCGGD